MITRALIVVLAVGVLAGCGGGSTAATTPGAATATAPARHAAVQPALCGRLRATVVGRADDPAATELSGLVVSASQPGVLWTHNDSGDRARIFALRASDGHVLASLDVPGAQAVDWEDIAVGPGGDLLLGDIGDNDAKRPDVVVYRIPEPRLASHPTATAPAQALTLTYPDGAHNAETLIADRRTGELIIVTKTLSGHSAIYSANVSGGARQVLKLRGHINFGLAGLTTAGDISADGTTVAIRTYSDLSIWHRRAGTSIAATLTDGTRCTTTLAAEGQGESLALTTHGTSFYTIPEGPSPPLRHYSSTLHP
ncbi:hypothetical protein [Conexibacter woesei]|uniref:hypothetical protein n=1 Tax=Conexibacter woesei TaxID=191495 RepID=UPI00041F22DC|nr:hypothetical protein [Conexibacter woesei]